MNNPNTLVVNSPDAAAFEADGTTPRVSSFVATVTVDGGTPFTVNLSVPTPSEDGQYRFSLTPYSSNDLLSTVSPFGGSAVITVHEKGPGGVGAESSPVTVTLNTPPATPSISLE